VVMHVVSNALDAMPQGGELRFQSQAENNWVRLEVVDTGIGMSAEILRRCFEPFFTTKGKHGTGMGLALAYGTARRHGGSIAIESEPAKGTRVVLSLPRAQAEAEQTEAELPAAVPPLHVLVIDDDPWSCSVMRNYLQKQQHSPDTAESGQAGIEKFRAGSYDLVIVDRAMPDMSGDKVAATLADIRPGIPVIMSTGFGEIMIDEGEHPPAVDLVLGKPITEAELNEAIARVYSRKRKATGAGEKQTG